MAYRYRPGRRKAWAALSEPYRRRLERFGITETTHNNPQRLRDITRARGKFAPTPEGRKTREDALYWRELNSRQGALRGTPKPFRDVIRRAVLIDGNYTSEAVEKIAAEYRYAVYLNDAGDTQTANDYLSSHMIDWEMEYTFDWINDLEVWYHGE